MWCKLHELLDRTRLARTRPSEWSTASAPRAAATARPDTIPDSPDPLARLDVARRDAGRSNGETPPSPGETPADRTARRRRHPARRRQIERRDAAVARRDAGRSNGETPQSPGETPATRPAGRRGQPARRADSSGGTPLDVSLPLVPESPLDFAGLRSLIVVSGLDGPLSLAQAGI